MKQLRAFCAGLMCFSLFCSMVRPLNADAQAYPKHLDKTFRADATLQVTKAVEIYTAAKAEFEKKGAKAFIDKFVSLAPKVFTETEKAFLSKKIAKELVLPTLLVKEDRLIGLEGKKEIFNLSTFEVAQGIFSFKEGSIYYNPNKGVIENFESWNKVQKQSLIESLFFPQAHAFTKMTGALVGALLGGVLAVVLWPMISKWFKGNQESSIPLDEGHGGGAVAPITTEAPAPTTTAPASTTTTTENGGAGSAEPKKDAPKDPKSKDAPKDPKEKDEPKTAGKIDEKTMKYLIKRGYRMADIKDEASLEAAKESPTYRAYALEMMKLIEEDFKAKKLSGRAADSALKAVVRKDSKDVESLLDYRKEIDRLIELFRK